LEENFHKNYFLCTFIQLFGFTLSINDGNVVSKNESQKSLFQKEETFGKRGGDFI